MTKITDPAPLIERAAFVPKGRRYEGPYLFARSGEVVNGINDVAPEAQDNHVVFPLDQPVEVGDKIIITEIYGVDQAIGRTATVTQVLTDGRVRAHTDDDVVNDSRAGGTTSRGYDGRFGWWVEGYVKEGGPILGLPFPAEGYVRTFTEQEVLDNEVALTSEPHVTIISGDIVVGVDWKAKWDALWVDLWNEATERGWCDDFDRFAEAHGEQGCSRERTYRVDLHVRSEIVLDLVTIDNVLGGYVDTPDGRPLDSVAMDDIEITHRVVISRLIVEVTDPDREEDAIQQAAEEWLDERIEYRDFEVHRFEAV